MKGKPTTTKSASKSAAPKAAKKTARKAARKTAKKAPKAKAPKAEPKKPTVALRGQVDMTIAKALEFVGGDKNTVLSFSRKSLVEAQTANAKAASAAALEDLDDESDL